MNRITQHNCHFPSPIRRICYEVGYVLHLLQSAYCLTIQLSHLLYISGVLSRAHQQPQLLKLLPKNYIFQLILFSLPQAFSLQQGAWLPICQLQPVKPSILGCKKTIILSSKNTGITASGRQTFMEQPVGTGCLRGTSGFAPLFAYETH